MTIELAATTAAPDEVSLLAACMNGFDPRDTGITAEDFDEPKHGKTWNAMISVLDSGKQIDPATVVAQLGDPSLVVDERGCAVREEQSGWAIGHTSILHPSEHVSARRRPSIALTLFQPKCQPLGCTHGSDCARRDLPE